MEDTESKLPVEPSQVNDINQVKDNDGAAFNTLSNVKITQGEDDKPIEVGLGPPREEEIATAKADEEKKKL